MPTDFPFPQQRARRAEINLFSTPCGAKYFLNKRREEKIARAKE
jgi:hypothetical protein